MKPTRIKLSDIRTDGGTQGRAAINADTSAHYAERMQEGDEFPAIVVFYDGTAYWLADGFHRVDASKNSDLIDIEATVRMGTQQDARDYACSGKPNGSHGLQESKEDRMRRVMAMVEDHQDWTLNKVADHCGVSHMTVKRVRESIFNNVKDATERTVTRNGTTYTQNTANIGKSRSTTVIDSRGVVVEDARVITETFEVAGVEEDEPEVPEVETAHPNRPAISPHALKPVLGHSDPDPAAALTVSRNPIRAAALLLSVFGADYIVALAEELIRLAKEEV